MDPGTNLETVHARHLHVQKDQVVGALGSHRQGQVPALGHIRFAKPPFQRVRQRVPAESFVVHHQ